MPSEIVLTNDKHYNDIASAIRNKNGLSTLYKPSEMAEAINALVVGGTITLQDKTVNPSEETQTITHDTGYMGLGEVTVTPILTEVKTVTENGNVYPTTGKYLTRVTVNVPQGGGEINNQNKSVTPTESQQSVTYDDGYTGLGTVTVGAISSTYVGSGITQRSSTDLTASGATVTVPAGYYSEQASKAVATGSAGTPTATKGTVSNHAISVTPSVTNTTGYITGGTKTGTAVTVSASELVSGKKEITANGDNIDVTNYAQVKVAIPGDTPTIDSLTVTPSESEQTFNSSSVDGYKPVTVGAISSTYVGSGIDRKSSTDLTVSGATVTAPAGYYSSRASKSVSSGSATGPSSLTASSATVSTGTNTITLTKTGVTTTPTVSAGYVSSATSSTATVALTASVTTKGATTYTPGTTDQTISSGTYLTGTQTISGSSNLVAGNIKQGVTIFGVTGSYSGSGTSLQAKSVNPTESEQEITPDSGYDGLSKVTVAAIPSNYVGSSILRGSYLTPSSIGTPTDDYYIINMVPIDPFYFTTAQQGFFPRNQFGDATTNQVLAGATFTSAEGINIEGTIDTKSSTDLTASGATVSVPAGYYASTASKSVASGSATNSGTASASSATITTGTNTITLSKAVSITPTVTAGYISSGTAGSVTVSLTGSATIDPTPTASGKTVTIPAGYYTESTTKDVSTGSATGPTSLSGSSASITTGTNTITLTKTGVTTTPTVSAGYVSSATASTATVALTASVTTKAAATITPGTTDQTIASGTYLTGTQTISGDSDLVAGNIKSGVQIFGVTGSYSGLDTSDATATAADIINGLTAYADGRKLEGSLVVQKYYTGSTTPSGSLGNNGDIYFQS